MTSSMPLSSGAEWNAEPSRLAGTIRQYSKNAIPQLTRITANSGEDLYFRCPYQAKVMKMLEAVSSRIGSRRSKGGIGAIRRGGTGQKDHRSSRRLRSEEHTSAPVT